MSRFIFGVIIFFLIFSECLNLTCYHCIEQRGVCVHPDHYYPAISFCGGQNNIRCVTHTLVKTPKKYYQKAGVIRMTMPSGTKRVVFKGCAKVGFCKTYTNEAKWMSATLLNLHTFTNSCRECSKNLCNSVCDNTVHFNIFFPVIILLNVMILVI